MTSSSLQSLTCKHIELYSKEYDGWFAMSMSDFNHLLEHKGKRSFSMNEHKEYKIVSSINQSPFKPKVGDYAEFKLEMNISAELDPNNIIILKPNTNNIKPLTMWLRGKIITELGNSGYLIEYNNKLYDVLINNIRMLSMSSERDVKLFYWCSTVFPDVYKYINNQLSNLSQFAKEHTFYDYNPEKNEFYIITESKTMIFIKEIIDQKQEEAVLIKKYDIEIENNEKNLNKLNMILHSNLKEILRFQIYFKKSIELEVNAMSIQYTIVNSNEKESGVSNDDANYFSLILYSKNQNQLDKAKEVLNYKEEKIENKNHVGLSEIESTVSKAKLQHFHASEDMIYLLGKEKNINDFKKLWSIIVKYSEKIQQTKIESENMKKELTTLKKQYKIK